MIAGDGRTAAVLPHDPTIVADPPIRNVAPAAPSRHLQLSHGTHSLASRHSATIHRVAVTAASNIPCCCSRFCHHQGVPEPRACALPYLIDFQLGSYNKSHGGGGVRESSWLYRGWVLRLRGHTTSKGMSEMMTGYRNEGHAYHIQVVLVQVAYPTFRYCHYSHLFCECRPVALDDFRCFVLCPGRHTLPT